eukprot:6481474-Amphidinium_carterae.3
MYKPPECRYLSSIISTPERVGHALEQAAVIADRIVKNLGVAAVWSSSDQGGPLDGVALWQGLLNEHRCLMQPGESLIGRVEVLTAVP